MSVEFKIWLLTDKQQLKFIVVGFAGILIKLLISAKILFGCLGDVMQVRITNLRKYNEKGMSSPKSLMKTMVS